MTGGGVRTGNEWIEGATGKAIATGSGMIEGKDYRWRGKNGQGRDGRSDITVK